MSAKKPYRENMPLYLFITLLTFFSACGLLGGGDNKDPQKPSLRNYAWQVVCVLLIILVSGCNPPSSPEEEKPIKQIDPTEAQGPGGPAYLSGDIKDYVHRPDSATNIDLHIMDAFNYSDTLLHVFIDSENGSFKITELPETTVDLIFSSDDYLTAKIGKLKLKPFENSFYNPNSSGFFIDSTVYITSIADSVGKPDAPVLGLQGYVQAVTVYFKWETPDSVAFELVQDSGCDTLVVYRYDDPVFDPYENDVYNLKCPNIKSIPYKLRYFNWLNGVKSTSPNFEVTAAKQ